MTNKTFRETSAAHPASKEAEEGNMWQLKREDQLITEMEVVDLLAREINNVRSGDEAADFLKYYYSPCPPTILQKMSEVDAYVRHGREVDPRTVEARQIIQEGLNENAAIIRETEAIFFLYGSIQFGDPRNLDADLFMFVNKELSGKELREVGYSLEKYFRPKWPWTKDNWRSEVHIDPFSRSDYLQFFDALHRRSCLHVMDLVVHWSRHGDLGIILSGECLHESDFVKQMRLRIIREANNNRVLRALLLANYDVVITDRNSEGRFRPQY